MRLYAKCLPEYFEMLDYKIHEFRQIESIALENSETHETRTFEVVDIHTLTNAQIKCIKSKFSKVCWDEKLPFFAIELGKEIKVEQAAHIEVDRNERDGAKDEIFPPRRKHEYR